MIEDDIYELSTNHRFDHTGELTFTSPDDHLVMPRLSSLNLSPLPAMADLRLTFKRRLPPPHHWLFLAGLTLVRASVFAKLRPRIEGLVDFVELEPLISANKMLVRPTESDATYVAFYVTKLVDAFDPERAVWEMTSTRWGETLYRNPRVYCLKEIKDPPCLFKLHHVPRHVYFAPKAFAEEIEALSKGTVEIESVTALNQRLARYREEKRLFEEREAARNKPLSH